MTDKNHTDDLFPSAAEDVRYAEPAHGEADAFRLAFNDAEFLLRDDLRAVRLQLEWLKPDLIQQELGIESSVVIFGGTRFPDPDQAAEILLRAKAALAEKPDDPALIKQYQRAEAIRDNSRFYLEARNLAKTITQASLRQGGKKFVVVTGGGPGIMEAANRGAADAGGKSIALNIVLPHEQKPNAYVTPELCFQFHYFALRKMHFLKRARALVACPGGFGTLDELFETLTLVQTQKIKPLPVVLMGRQYWSKLINFEFLAEQGALDAADLNLFSMVDSADEAWSVLQRSWAELRNPG